MRPIHKKRSCDFDTMPKWKREFLTQIWNFNSRINRKWKAQKVLKYMFSWKTNITFAKKITNKAVHEITAGHQSLCGTISYVTDRIRFQISIVYHIQMTSLNRQWPAQSVDCRTPYPALAKYLFQTLHVNGKKSYLNKKYSKYLLQKEWRNIKALWK